MGMFDIITDVPVQCPKCGNNELKNAQIKSGPQQLNEYRFGKDKIPLNWNYTCYGSVIEMIDENNGKIRGIAECPTCRIDKKETYGYLFDVILEIKDGIVKIVFPNASKAEDKN